MFRSMSLVVVVPALLATLWLAGCDGANPPPAGAGGSVTGRVVAGLQNPVGFGNVRIIIAGQSALSDANGFFTVQNIPPGRHEVEVEVDPETGFVVPPNTDPIIVDVFNGQNTNLPGPIVVIDENDLPPGPP